MELWLVATPFQFKKFLIAVALKVVALSECMKPGTPHNVNNSFKCLITVFACIFWQGKQNGKREYSSIITSKNTLRLQEGKEPLKSKAPDENHVADEMQFVRPNELDTPLRRSERGNKGVPPMRYGYPLSL